MPRTSRSGDAGFTLVEMMMAMLIMTVGLLGLLQSIQVAYRNNARNAVRDQGVLVAYNSMNDFKRRPYQDISRSFYLVSSGRRKYSVTREAEEIGTSSGAKKLMVRVAWKFEGVSANQQIYTFKAR
jgi:type IV pilus assembly protein PilV